jgi:hypothetical protein
MLVEPFASDRLEENINAVGKIYYSACAVICVAHALSEEGGLALGAQAREARLAKLFHSAGYSSFRRAAETPFNLILEARVEGLWLEGSSPPADGVGGHRRAGQALNDSRTRGPGHDTCFVTDSSCRIVHALRIGGDQDSSKVGELAGNHKEGCGRLAPLTNEKLRRRSGATGSAQWSGDVGPSWHEQWRRPRHSGLFCGARYKRAARASSWCPKKRWSDSKFGVGGDGGESNSPSRRRTSRIYYKLSWVFNLAW